MNDKFDVSFESNDFKEAFKKSISDGRLLFKPKYTSRLLVNIFLSISNTLNIHEKAVSILDNNERILFFRHFQDKTIMDVITLFEISQNVSELLVGLEILNHSSITTNTKS